MRLDEGLVVAALADEQVHPRQQQRQIGAGLDRQPVLGLAGGDGEARVDHDHRHAPLDRLGKLLHLRVVHVLAQVRADQHQAVGALDVGRLGRADAAAEGQLEADVARAAALRIRRPGVVDDAVALQHVLDETLPEAVVEQRDRLRTVLGLDLGHTLGDVAEGHVPADGLPLLLAALADAQQRLADAVRVVVRTDGAGAARAQPAVALRVLRIALELPQLAVAHVGDATAAPEAHLAESGNGRHRAGRRRRGLGQALHRRPLRAHRGGAEGGGGNRQEATAGEVWHEVAFAAPPRCRLPAAGGRASFLIRCLEA